MAIFSPCRAIAESPGTVREGVGAVICGPPRLRPHWPTHLPTEPLRCPQKRGPSASWRAQIEEFPPAAHALDVREEQLEMLGIVDEVQPLAVDDQNRRLVVLVEIPAVRIGQPRQVRFGDRA